MMNQKVFALASIGIVIASAVLVNEFVLKTGDKDRARKLASFGERFEPEQIKWEQELAKTISKDKQAKTVVAVKPSHQDRLMFEALEGRYQAQVEGGQIRSISLLPNQAPLELKVESFVKEYAGLIKAYSSFEIVENSGTRDVANHNAESTVNLKAKNGDVVGKLVFRKDDKGRVTTIEVQ